MRYAPALVDLLESEGADSTLNRAVAVELRLREACHAYGEDWGGAMTALLRLAAGTHGAPLKTRRRQAADILDVQVETFRRHYESEILWDLAAKLSVATE